MMTRHGNLIHGLPGDNYRVYELGKGFWRIQEIKGSTIYLIEGSQEALLIDTGAGADGLKEIVDELIRNKPLKVALSHGHSDHIGGMRSFRDVYLHKADASMLLPGGLDTVQYYTKDGQVFDLGDQKIAVIYIPGHTRGSVAFINEAGRYILTGDGIGSTFVWAHLPSSDPLTVYLASLRKLEAMKDAIDELYVGHHEQEAVKLTPEYIKDMRIVTERVLEGTIDTRRFEMGARSGKQATYGSATVMFNPDRLR